MAKNEYTGEIFGSRYTTIGVSRYPKELHYATDILISVNGIDLCRLPISFNNNVVKLSIGEVGGTD